MQFKKRFDDIRAWRLFGILLLSTTLSQSFGQKIPFDNYTNQNGLPQNTVYDIDQDLEGYLWFATQVGATRFDGYDFEYFSSDNGLSGDNVNCLMVDQKGKVWMGTEKGISVFDGSQFSVYTTKDGLIDNQVDKMIEDQDGNVWIATPNGLSVVMEDTILNYSMENALIDNAVIELFNDSRGRVHVATFPGLTIFKGPILYEKRYEEQIIRDILETRSGEIWYATQENGIIVTKGGKEKFLGKKDGLSDTIVFCVLEDRDGRIWCGTYPDGLFIYEKGLFTRVPNENGADLFAAEMYEDSNHRIWIRTFEDGVWLIEDGAFKHITVKNNLVNNNVRDIFEDKFGNVWFGTLGGVSKHGRVIFEIYDRDLGLPVDHISSVYIDSKERIWFGTYGSLLYKDRFETHLMDHRSGFQVDAMPLSFAEDKKGFIYVGTDEGLWVYDGHRFNRRKIEDVKETRVMNNLLFSTEGDLWCATDSGIVVIDDKEVSLIKKKEGLVNLQVNALALQGSERICCATEGGISVFTNSGQHVKNFSTEDGLVSEVCIDVTTDSEGNIWVATNRGLSRIKKDLSSGIKNYTKQNGLTSNMTYFVEFSDEHTLWIGTERGINVLNTAADQIEFYGYEDGFYPLETNARAISKGKDGELWIGTVGGLVHYFPKYDVLDSMPPVLILFPPEVNGETLVSENMEPALPYNRNSLEFTFTGIHTTSPQQNRFSYYLEGYDENWSVPGSFRMAEYKKIPHGSYIFRVKAYNLDGISVEKDASFAFTILPPFWKTRWFVLLEIFFGLLLVYGIIKFRERKLLHEKKILEVRVIERTREIEDQKVEIEAQRDEIFVQKRYVEEQRDQIVVQNKEITDSIRYAKRIQEAVLPGKQTLERCIPEHFIFFKPRDIVSGDFYWAEEKEGLIIACVADCTGHGVPGAFMSMLGLTFLNEIVNKDGIIQANEILNRLRAYIIRALSNQDEAGGARDGMDVALVIINRQEHQLEYAGAYNPLLLVRDGEMLEFKADKMPIGKHVGEEGSFTSHRIELKDSDMIYLYSDGFKDQFGGERGTKYKSGPFTRLLQGLSSEPLDKQGLLLNDEFNAWRGDENQVDDILIMGIRYTGNQT